MHNKYWLKEPAPEIELALSIGNGRMGASIWGNVDNDWITINEEGMWYGGKRSRKNRYASQYLNKIRRDMNFLFRHPAGQAEDYRRELDMDAAQTRVNYRIGDTVYTREYFVSMKYQVLGLSCNCFLILRLPLHRRIRRRSAGKDWRRPGLPDMKLSYGNKIWLPFFFQYRAFPTLVFAGFSYNKTGLFIQYTC